MLNPASPLGRLLDAPIRPGVVQWIGVRSARRAAMLAVPAAGLDPALGLDGDHYRSATARKRQVTLIGALDLVAIAAALGRDRVTAEQLRRNIVVDGINLHALRGRHFRLGTALLEATGDCHPCSRMEEILGVGGYNAVRGHGGITARIVSMPSWQLFERQEESYKLSVLPNHLPKLAVEAGATLGWWKWVGRHGDVIGLDRFGASAPGTLALEKLGFGVDNIVSRAKALLEKAGKETPALATK